MPSQIAIPPKPSFLLIFGEEKKWKREKKGRSAEKKSIAAIRTQLRDGEEETGK